MQQNFLTVYIPDGVYARQENGRSSNMACFRYCPNETRLRSRIHLNGKTSIIKMKRKECSGENNQVKIAGMPKVYSERLISHSCPHGMCVRVRSHQYACRAHTHTHTEANCRFTNRSEWPRTKRKLHGTQIMEIMNRQHKFSYSPVILLIKCMCLNLSLSRMSHKIFGIKDRSFDCRCLYTVC